MRRYVCIFLLTALLCGCSEKTTDSTDTAATPSATPAFSTVEAADSYQDIPFKIWAEEDSAGLEYALFARSWNGAEEDSPSYGEYFSSLYGASGAYPQAVYDGTVLHFSFGGNDVSQVTVTRDADTYHGSGGARGTVDVGHAGGVYSFAVSYDGAGYLYYVIRCQWENGNAVEYALYISTPEGHDGYPYLAACADYLAETEPDLYADIDYSTVLYQTISEGELLAVCYLVEDPGILDETDIVVTIITTGGDRTFQGVVDAETAALIGYLPGI